MPDEIDLEIVETDALIEELRRRSDAFILGRIAKGDKDSQAVFDSHGGRFVGIGLATLMLDGLVRDNDDEEETDDG